MKSPITKLAAAAVVIVTAVLLARNFFDRTSSPAYAIEQTIQANHTVRYIHIKHFDSEDEGEPAEFWVECGEFGEMKRARLHLPEWSSPKEGAMAAVWKENKLQIWVKRRNVLLLIRDKTVAENMLKAVERCDPRLAVKHLHERQQQNEIRIKIEEPSDKAKPIVITATHMPKSPTPNRWEVLFVDQATKLVICKELYESRNGKYEYVGRQEYCDYNQPISDEMFSMDDELPVDVMRIDQVTQEVGLTQGQLSEHEIAVEVVRELFEALIAKDYAKAGRLAQGIPGSVIEQDLGQVNFLRIVSIGPVAPHPDPGSITNGVITKGFVVPCTVEVESNGAVSEWKLDGLWVGQVIGQPGRWTLCGGLGIREKNIKR